MAQQFNPNFVREGTVTLLNGDVVTFDGNQLQGWMQQQQQQGVNVPQLADGAQAAIGLLEKMDINGFIEDEKDAREDLLAANTKVIEYWTKKDPGYAAILREQMAAQEDLDEAQTRIGRSLDKAVLVASGAAGAKAIFAGRLGIGGGYAVGGGNAGNLALGALGAYGVLKLLDDDDQPTTKKKRKALGPGTTPPA